MIILGMFVCIAAIGILCWLLFTLAIFALPLFVGGSAGTWAFNTGAGWLGAVLVGILAAGSTLGVRQILLGVISPMWAKLALVVVFVAPAIAVGYHATHGIAKHMMPSETWQSVFSVIGATAVGVTAYLRVANMRAADQSGRDVVRAWTRVSGADGPDRGRPSHLLIGGWSNRVPCQDRATAMCRRGPVCGLGLSSVEAHGRPTSR
ncbi:hypothetical protein X735_32520 [Mesorhizobium sp. L2C085B000]|nr:hypothetical protein X735_32520 [Mesorhizobium sp. L2C085B000]